MNTKKILFNCLILIISTILSLLIIEIFLRYTVNPITNNLKRVKIELPTNFTNEINYNYNSSKIQNHITVTKNLLGFRGPNPPLNLKNYLSIITIGGSTTECVFITEGKTWSDILSDHLSNNFKNIWINNAGIDGHSSFGHIELLKKYIINIKPKIATFLVGINDIPLDRDNDYDNIKITSDNSQTSTSILKKIESSSLIVQSINYMFFQEKGRHGANNDNDFIVDFNSLSQDNKKMKTLTNNDLNIFNKQTEKYKERLQIIINICKNADIEPIFITQPAVFGFGIDKTTEVDLGKIYVQDFTESIGRSGKDKWEILQMFNQATKDIATKNNVFLIDLANEMPKDSKYFYDFIHYTEEGANEVATIINNDICPHLQLKYPNFKIKDCELF